MAVTYTVVPPASPLVATQTSTFNIYVTGGSVPGGLTITVTGTTGLTIIPSPVTVSSTGVATFTVTPATNSTYAISFTNNSSLPDVPTINFLVGYVGTITNETSLKQYLGGINVQWMSDPDSDGVEDEAAVAQCIQAAEDEVNAIVAGSSAGYTSPLTFGTNPISPALQRYTNVLAGCYMYEKRLLVNMANSADAPKFDYMRKQAEDWLKKVWDGDITLIGASITTISGTAPIGVNQTVNQVGQPINPLGYPWPFWGGGFGGNWWW